MYEDIPAFEEGPCFTAEGQYGDPDFVVIEENPTIKIDVIDGWEKLVVNPEIIPLTGEDFTVEPTDIDQDINIADFEAVIYA